MSNHNSNSLSKKDRSPEHQYAIRNPSVDWHQRFAFPRPLLHALERFSLAFEKPINRMVRDGRFNPLYHTGTITVFLLFIILATGIYLTMFYQFGFESSYDSISQIEANFVGRIVRALHRYASGSAVIFALLHGWRTFFQDRFRGPRWLAWLSGVLMAALVWLIGVTGYWLIWDQRAGVLNQTLINLLKDSQLGTLFLVDYLVSEAAGTGWIFLVLVITAHLGLSAVVGLFFWLHIKRLSRAKWLPPRHWIIVVTALLVLASVLIPVGMLAPIDPARQPETITLDLFYLFYLPAGLNWQPQVIWGGILLLVILATALPWLLTRKPLQPVVVDAALCTGCTLCAADCPYQAIEMVKREDRTKHKFLAVIDPQMCVACGICIGTCEPLAMTLNGKPAEGVWQETLARISETRGEPVRVVFACERHAYQNLTKFEDERVQIVPLICIGMAHPNLAVQALEAGASEVHFIGCPPEDCTNREGNIWLQERLDRERLPRLNQKFKTGPIYSDWLPPNEFSQALEKPNQQRHATTYKIDFSQIQGRKFILAILLLAMIFALQIWLSDRPYRPYSAETAWLEIVLDHKAGYPIQETETNLETELGLNDPTRLILQVDGRIQWEQSYTPQRKTGRAIAFEQISLTPGEHHVQLQIFDRPNQTQGQILYDQGVSLQKYDILHLSYSDAPLRSDPAAGEKLFFESSLGVSASCHVCHSLEVDEIIVGPSLAGIATRAAERVSGMTTEAYLRSSIMDPDAYIVDGYPAGLMLPDLEENLSKAQIDDLIAFLLTLK